jgi:hydroxyacylglutathione hydrolase
MISERMILRQVEVGPMLNYAYLAGCAVTREAAVVDPAWDVPRILELARELNLKINRILLSHAHPDHINGLEELLEATDAAVFLHEEEVAYMKQVAARFGMSLDFMDRHRLNFHADSDGEEIDLGKLSLKFLHTPGHTPGSQCFLVEKSLFSGDTLFVDACGRVDLPGSDPEKMWWSLNRKLRGLDDDTILYPGHDYSGRSTSTIGEQKRTNRWMQYDSLDDFLCDMRAR